MEKTIAQIIAERLQDRLDAVHPTRRGQQSWLARQVGMKQQGINSILAGAVERPKKLREISEALQTSQAYLLGETDNPAPDGANSSPLSGDDEIIAMLERIDFIGPGSGVRALNLLKGVFEDGGATRPHNRAQEQSAPSNRRREQVP